MAEQNPWKFWLEEQPQAAHGAFRPQTGSRNFMDYWRGQQGNVRGDYMGQLGQMASGGQPPSLNWTDYLQNYPFMAEWMRMSPGQRGAARSPSMRWNIPW